MKKIITLALAAGMMAAAAAPASAADIKVDGQYSFQFVQKSSDFKGTKMDSEFSQLLLGVTATASENLSGYAQLKAAWDWGRNSYWNGNNEAEGNAYDGAGIHAYLYQAYIDWLVPNTSVKVRMGRHFQGLPGLANGKNPAIWSVEPNDGITVSAPVTDWMNVTAWWGRNSRNMDAKSKTVLDTCKSETVDVFALLADLKFDGVKVTPFVAYAAIGDEKAGYGNNGIVTEAGEANAYWAGFASQLTMFDPIIAKLGFVYGDRDYTNKDLASQHGWMVDASVAYKTPYGTPELLAWFGTGDDKEDQLGKGNLPSIAGRFKGTYGFYNGSMMFENEMNNLHTAAGNWGVRLGMTGISFLEGLTHDVAVAYAQGTNAQRQAKAAITEGKGPMKYMTTKDSMVEFDFGTNYAIYKNLSARLEAAYIIEDFQTKRAGNFATRDNKYNNAWKVALQLQYKF